MGKLAFYERFIRSADVIQKGIAAGLYVKGRIYHTLDSEPNPKNKNLPPIVTPVGYVKVDGIPQAIKVWGLKNLNRTYNMDEVVLKFV